MKLNTRAEIFELLKFRINGVIFTEHSKEFEQAKMWEKLKC